MSASPEQNKQPNPQDSTEPLTASHLNVSLPRAFRAPPVSVRNLLASFSEAVVGGKPVSLSGRVLSVRCMRDYWFADLFDEGSKLQLIGDKSTGLPPPPPFAIVTASGRAVFSRTNEKSLQVAELSQLCKGTPQASREQVVNFNDRYENLFARNLALCRTLSLIRKFFETHDFNEVATPLLLEGFNGGRSFPVAAMINEKRIGFIRTTFEEKMLALVGIGIPRVYQIGSVARSFKELIFLEGYATNISFEEGMMLLKSLFAYFAAESQSLELDERIVKGEWQQIRFADAIVAIFGKGTSFPTGKDLAAALIDYGITEKFASPETAADLFANFYAQQHGGPLFLTHMPGWSSPLYVYEDCMSETSYILRGRGYLPNQHGGIDFGVQENDPAVYRKRVEDQRQQHS